MKKIVHLLLCLIMALSTFPLKVFAEQTMILSPVFVQSQYLTRDVSQLKNEALSLNSHKNVPQKPSDQTTEKEQEGLADQFNDKKDFLIFKNKTLVEKYQQLLDFKAQLLHSQEELQDLKVRYQTLVDQSQDK